MARWLPTFFNDWSPPMQLLYERRSSRPIDEVGERLRRAAMQHKFGVLGVIDLREQMFSEGVDFEWGCRIYEVCNPYRAKELLERNMEMSTVLPCRISVYEETGGVTVATVLPTVLMDIFQTKGVWLVANQVQEDLKAIIDEAAN